MFSWKSGGCFAWPQKFNASTLQQRLCGVLKVHKECRTDRCKCCCNRCSQCRNGLLCKASS